MDRLAGMEAFVAVVETGGFSSAGKKLGQSRAVIGKRVAALEKALGAQLLNRTTRTVSVTGVGGEFYQRCRSIVSEFDDARQELARNQIEPAGVIKLNAPMSFGQMFLAPVLLEFMDRFPEIVLQLTLSDRYVDVVAEGYDLVLRIGALEDSSLIVRRLATLRRILCASPSYVAEAGTLSEPDDLTAHRILHYGWGRTGTQWRLVGPEAAEVNIDVMPAFCANNGEVLAAAAVAGQGIVLIPEFIVDAELKAGRLVRVLPAYEATAVELHALWPSNRLLPTRVRRLIDFLVERIGDLAPAESV